MRQGNVLQGQSLPSLRRWNRRSAGPPVGDPRDRSSGGALCGLHHCTGILTASVPLSVTVQTGPPPAGRSLIGSPYDLPGRSRLARLTWLSRSTTSAATAALSRLRICTHNRTPFEWVILPCNRNIPSRYALRLPELHAAGDAQPAVGTAR